MNARTFIDIHLLQSVPPSCINRDDTGSPKTAVYGGVRRARVSSQAWKRATRNAFSDLLDTHDLGVRTKRIVDLVAEQIAVLRPQIDPQTRASLAASVVGASGLKLEKARAAERQESQYLVLVSRQQASTLASIAVDLFDEAPDVDSALKSIAAERKKAKQALAAGNSIDLALFGRMVANDTDLNVDAACQVAHALSVHPATNEFDYFTAVDDLKPPTADDGAADAGAGMIGTVEFTSATLYRYASISVHELVQNLGDAAMARRGIEAFIRAFALSMPTGKVNTFANHTVPDVVVVTVRHDQPVSWVGAFEKPVRTEAEGGFVRPAAESMVAWAQDLAEAYSPAAQVWTVAVGDLKETVSSLGTPIPFSELAPLAALTVVPESSDDA